MENSNPSIVRTDVLQSLQSVASDQTSNCQRFKFLIARLPIPVYFIMPEIRMTVLELPKWRMLEIWQLHDSDCFFLPVPTLMILRGSL